MFFAYDHNYAQHVPDYIAEFDTHRRCKERLEQNGFSVSLSLVLCMRNAFDITIKQTINPGPSYNAVL